MDLAPLVREDERGVADYVVGMIECYAREVAGQLEGLGA